jgi:hypothetical protein
VLRYVLEIDIDIGVNTFPSRNSDIIYVQKLRLISIQARINASTRINFH